MEDGAKCKDLRPILKEIDKELDISFNQEAEMYIITHKGMYFMSVKYGEFDRKTVESIRKTVWTNINSNIVDEIEVHNSKIDAQKDRELSNMAESMAKDIRKPLAEAYYHGELG